MQAPAPTPVPFWSRLFLWLGPALLCLVIYWHGLCAWFQMDDFAWLSLHREVVDFPSFLKALFRPLAQGTIRPWSERLFFLAGWHVFGMEATAYRAIAFATMFADLILLTVLTRRLTRSDIAAVAAPVLWVTNGNLYTPMAWTSAYNQLLCVFFLLAALLLWVRYTETGQTRFYVWQWVVFVLGFGALELNLVYPALAALHALCFARRYLAHSLPMFPVSAAFIAVHRLFAPAQSEDIYRMYFDSSIFETLATFAGWIFSTHRYASYRGLELWPFYLSAIFAGTVLAFVAVRLILQRNWLPIFCIGWFLMAIAPVLPLRNHRTDYYVAIPVIGFAILAGAGLALAWHSRWPRLLAIAAALAYALPGAWMAQGMSRSFCEHSSRVKHLVRGLAGAAREHPDKVLLISGVDNNLFWRAWYSESFRALGLRHVYLTRKTAAHIEWMRRDAKPHRYFLADAIAVSMLERRMARVYEVLADGRLRDATGLTLARLQRQPLAGPGFLDVRTDLSSVYVGEGWWPAEGNHRWMSAKASVQLRGPRKSPGELVLRGFCVPAHVRGGPVHLSVSVDGIALRPAAIDRGNLQFELHFPLPPAVTGKSLIKVDIAMDRPLLIASDGRNLGAAFGTFEVSP